MGHNLLHNELEKDEEGWCKTPGWGGAHPNDRAPYAEGKQRKLGLSDRTIRESRAQTK